MAGLPGHDAPRAVFLRFPQAPDARHHGPVWTRRTVLCEVFGDVAMSCGGDSFSPYGAYDFAWHNVKPCRENTSSITSSTLVFVGCVFMLNDWISCMTILAPTTTTTFSSS